MSTYSFRQLPERRVTADNERDATNDKRNASVTHATDHRDVVVDLSLFAAKV
jgi:hypothetical protein